MRGGAGSDVVAVDTFARYSGPAGGTAVASCDIYEFGGRRDHRDHVVRRRGRPGVRRLAAATPGPRLISSARNGRNVVEFSRVRAACSRLSQPVPAGGPMETPVRVVIADDDVLLREGVASLLARAGFDVVGQAGDGDELLAMVRDVKPELVVADIRMPPTHTNEGLGRCAGDPRRAARHRDRGPVRACRHRRRDGAARQRPPNRVPAEESGHRCRRLHRISREHLEGRIDRRPRIGPGTGLGPSPRRPAGWRSASGSARCWR